MSIDEETLGGDPNDRRRARRFGVRAPAQYANSSGGTGTTENISISGVLIENASTQVGLGATVELRFSFYPGSFDTPFAGHVIRHTESGFALQFADIGDDQLALLRTALPPSAFAEV
jgi:hypothetical protein